MRKAAFDTYNRFELYEHEPMETPSSQNLNGRNMIFWHSLTGYQTENGDILSPATILEHEFDHAVSMEKNYKEHIARKKKVMQEYTNAEEYRVITGSETKTARANGEISLTKPQSRYSHSSPAYVPVESPISNKVRNTKERKNNNTTKIKEGLYHYGK